MTDRLERLADRLKNRTAAVAVVGLGYVGLPLACLVAARGFKVTGIDRDAARVALMRGGTMPIEGAEPGLEELFREVTASGQLGFGTGSEAAAACDLALVCVETPVDPQDHRPRFDALRAACQGLAASMVAGSLVVVESTLAPGTMDQLVAPILRSRGLLVGHCPERVMPGRLLSNMTAMSRVLGAESQTVAELMRAFYEHFVEGELDAADLVTAELVKVAENAYRDVNIAFANELALVCEEAGGDVWRVRELVNKSPGRNVLLPGAGVGGHCIPKDPWLLAAGMRQGGAAALTATARMVNEGMPAVVARLTAECLGGAGLAASGARVAVLGFAYLPDSDDVRASPSESLVAILRAEGCEVRIHDPFVALHRGDLGAVLGGADCAVLMVAHSDYRALDLAWMAGLMRNRLLVDGRGFFLPAALEAAGFDYRILGRGLKSAGP